MLNKKMVFFLLALFVLNIAVFLFIFPSFWVADDFYYIWASRFSNPGEMARALFSLSTTDYFRPFFYLAFGINWAIFGLNTSGYYLINFIVHLLNAVLVFCLIRKMTKNENLGMLTATLFLVFPAHWEAVGWLNPINHLLMTTFFLGAAIKFVDYDESGSAMCLAGSAALFALALSTHEGAIMLLALLPVYLLLKRKPAGSLLKLWPFAAVFVLYFAANVMKNLSLVSAKKTYSVGLHIIPNLLDYMATLIIPVITTYKLSALLPEIMLKAIIFSKISLMFILPAAAAALFFRLNPISRFFLAWPAVTILPYCLFTSVPPSRYLYLPSVGFVFLLSSLILFIYDRAGSKKLIAAGTLILIFLYLAAMMAYQKVYYYKKEIRRSILNDLKAVMPEIEPGSRLYFIDIPLRQDEIKYMTYLWFGENYEVRLLEENETAGSGISADTCIFTYRSGKLIPLVSIL